MNPRSDEEINQIAAAYIRVSTLDQTEFSPDAQLKQIKDYARKNNLLLVEEHIYADEGISGRSTGKRVAFNRMIKNAKKKPRPFDVILIHKFNRFARNREDAIIFKSLLKRDCGIKVISITEPIEDDKIGIIIESVLDAFSEYYSVNLSEEVKKGMAEKASRGGVQSRPPLGYDVVDNKFVVNAEESKIVKLIFDQFIQRESPYIAIAKDLNEMGLKTKNGNSFQSKSIRYILSNPTYNGYLLWNKKEKNGAIRDPEEWIMAQGTFERIVTEDEFAAVQKRLASLSIKIGKNAQPSGSYQHFLSGLLVCHACGGKMVYTKSKSYTYFRCRKAKEGGCSIKKGIRTDSLEQAIIGQVDDDLKDIHMIVSDIEIRIKDSDLNFYQQQLKSVENRLSQAQIAYLSGVDTLDEYKKNKTNFLGQKSVIELHIQTVFERNEENNKKSINEKLGLVSEWMGKEIMVEHKSKILKSFIKQITVDISQDAFEIDYFSFDEE